MAKQVLFVCVHNAGRSQMAEAFFNRLAEEQGLALRAESAGTEPGEHVHPEVVSAMQEVGIDLSAKRPRRPTNIMVQEADRVITMGCAPDAGACPAILFRKVEDWGLPDPRGQRADRVREIRDGLLERVSLLLHEMKGGPDQDRIYRGRFHFQETMDKFSATVLRSSPSVVGASDSDCGCSRSS